MSRKIIAGLFMVLLVVSMIVGSTPVVADEGSNQGTKVIGNLQLGTFSAPLSLDDAKTIRNDVIDRSKSVLEGKNEPMVSAFPELQESQKIVAYGFIIDKDGIPSQYLGIAGDEESVSLVYKKAQEWYATEQANSEKTYEARGSFSEIGRYFNNYYLSPYGGVTNNQILYKLLNDNSSTYDWFAIQHIFAMEPGYQVYGSSWLNNTGYPQQNWSYGSLEYGLFDWDPLGSHTGQQTISVSLTGGTGGGQGTIGWSYTQPEVSTVDQSSTYTNIAKWSENENSSAAEQHTMGMKPGSTCQTYQPSSGTYPLYQLIAAGKFRKPHTWPVSDEWQTLTTTVNMSITY